MLLTLDRTRPLGDQIYLLVREAVLAGELRPGDRLPPSRSFARRLGVARNTVVLAYTRLQSEGYVTGMRAGGTRVAAVVRDDRWTRAGVLPGGTRRPFRRKIRLSAFGRRVATEPDIFPPALRGDHSHLRWVFDYNINVCDASSRRAWTRLLRKCAARHENVVAPYTFGTDPEPLQLALARYLKLTRGVVARPEQVYVIGNYQRAFQLAARLLVEPGDAVVMEDPQALRVRRAFLAAGARLIPGRSDDTGLRVDALPGRTMNIRLAYTSASCQWATGAVLPLARRLELLEWARRQDCWILENDHNSEYLYQGSPVRSLQGLDRDGRVIYVGTFSRLISPDPLIGYMVVPESLIRIVEGARLVEGHHGSPLEEEVLTHFIESGQMESLLRRTTRRLRDLRAHLLDALRALPGSPLEARDAQGGQHVHARMPCLRPGEVESLVKRAAAAGVGIFPDLPYYLRSPKVPGLILGFAAMSPREIREGIARLGQVLR